VRFSRTRLSESYSFAGAFGFILASPENPEPLAKPDSKRCKTQYCGGAETHYAAANRDELAVLRATSVQPTLPLMLGLLWRLVVSLFGEFSWKPPAWLASSSSATFRWTRLHRGMAAAILLSVLLTSAGGWLAYRAYERRPKPVTVAVSLAMPGITPREKELKPQALVLHFEGSVAPIENASGTPVTAGVRLEPPVPGTWEWRSDSRLAFFPQADWPAATKYRVLLDPKALSPNARLDRYELEGTTPPFAASMPKLEFYTDPTDPIIKQVIATVDFTHSVTPGELEKHLTLAMVGESKPFKPGEPPFTVTYGLHNRVAYVRTSGLTLPEQEDFMKVTVAKTLPTAQGGSVLGADVEDKVRVPDIYSFFKIDSIGGTIVMNDDGDPEQILAVRTSTMAKPQEIEKALKVYLLPKKAVEPVDDREQDHSENGESATRQSAQEIDEAVLESATEVPVKLVPIREETSQDHLFRIALETQGQLYAQIGKGVKALGGFVLRDDFAKVMDVPELPRHISIESAGGVLALTGERKLAIKSRGVEAIDFEINRIPADQINHLVSQTNGEYQSPYFRGGAFSFDNLARISTERQPINIQSKLKLNYSAFDFSKHLGTAPGPGSSLHGLFFLRARAAKSPSPETAREDEGESDDEEESDSSEEEENSSVAASRFVLVTDLGLIVKENADDSRDVFISSIRNGQPIGGVKVELLAKNGLTLLNGVSGPDGRVTFATQTNLAREKQPVAFVARLGNDVSFMPYSRGDRKLNYSRFDIGGVESDSEANLDAFVFTERGIYRPGDEMKVGVIAKQRNWQGKLEGLPLEVTLHDPSGESVHKEQIALPASGFAEISFQTEYQFPTGPYEVQVSLVQDGTKRLLLGSTSVNVKEFLPDRMKIEARLSTESKGGWIKPEGLSMAVTLRNLYGTPAANRKVNAKLELSAARFSFDAFPGYRFFDRAPDSAGREEFDDKVELGDQTTDENGTATYQLQLERFASATYSALLSVEGFEAGGGRSVSTHQRLLISPLSYVVGCKTADNLQYVPAGSEQSVEWIAINPQLERIALPEIDAKLIQRTYVSVLSKDDSGSWRYESVKKETMISNEKIAITTEGLRLPLATTSPGEFELQLSDQAGTRVGSVGFTVVGKGAVTRSLERDAELEVKLNSDQYKAGDEVEISIVAPYTGTGLISIERDKVYAHAWFRADQTSSVQKIRIPDDFEGTGYVNVCFVRGLDSKEVFISPLSYAAVPFTANMERRRLPVELMAPTKATPGEPMRIGYRTDRPAKIVVFAVDEGILQVSDFETPDPLKHFFRKAALMVGTSQIVDLIMPEFSVLRSVSAFGGDAEKRLNPFKRVTEKPVVFWSGVVDADTTEREVVYNVPDYFSGTLTIMAVAVAPDAVGAAEASSLVRGPFVITPSVPTVAAPGDLFDVSVAVANGVEGSGENAEVQLVVTPTEHLEIVKAPAGPLRITESREETFTYTVRALEKLGSASLSFHATTGGQSAKLRSTLSVRPLGTFMTSVRGGQFQEPSVEIPVERPLRPEFRKVHATLSSLPMGLASGLDEYLQNYPNGCSEQITSGAFTRLMLSDEVDFGLKRGDVIAQMDHTFRILRQRQNEHGSFGYWAMADDQGIDFVTAYVTHFLIEAKDAGFNPPETVLSSALRYLQRMVTVDPGDLSEARVIAYACYLLTREGVITTNYLLNLRDYLDNNHPEKWQKDLTAVYLAASWQMLKKTEEADRLIQSYRINVFAAEERFDFYSPLVADSQYVSIVARHFPELLKRITPGEFAAITNPISEGGFNTLSAAYAVIALKSYSRHIAQNAPELAISEVTAQGGEIPLQSTGSALLKRATFSEAAKALRFAARGEKAGFGSYYQVVEAGFDRRAPEKPQSEGLEVFREFVDEDGKPISTARVGEPITVRLRLRSLEQEAITNVAIIDLLPGGFELAGESLQPGPGGAGCDFVDVREDRVVFFTSVTTQVREITYQIKPTARGEFQVPPAFAEAMYDRGIHARGVASRIAATDR
jgi:uncharacterized protein YfaS (alpha-2-macroglobulin family)